MSVSQQLVRIYSICFCLLILAGYCDAQTMTLDSIAKFTFVRGGYILNGRYQNYDVEVDGNTWKCYQTDIQDENWGGPKNDLKKTFIKNISASDLQTLLDIMTKVGPGLNVNLFKMDQSVLVHDIDSLHPELKPAQRREILKAIHSKDILNKSIYHMLHDESISGDFSKFIIVVTTKSGCSITADARAYFLYDFPWNIEGAKSYDPNLAIIFNKVFDEPEYVKSELKRLHAAVVKDIYKNHFETRFNFDNVKERYPAAYKILSKTFVPIGFYPLAPINYVSGLFKSKLLPQNVRLNTYIYLDNILQINETKRFEDTVVQLLKKNNFLFKYMKSQVKGTMDFTPGDGLKRDAYINLKEVFPDIVKYDYRQIKQVQIYGNLDMLSSWLLLPDNTLILYRFAGSAQPDKTHIKLLNISSAIIDRTYGQGLYNTCILFDAFGKVIHNYGVPKGEMIQ